LISIGSALEVTLLATVQKEAFMGGHPFPPISCEICSKQVDLRVDLFADENGKAVHEHCYVKRVTILNSLPTVSTMTD
jgi:hypothetical protein